MVDGGGGIMRFWLHRAALSVACFLTIGAPAWANCDTPADEGEQLRCASAELRASDQRINRLYGELRAKLDQEGQKQLLIEQRAWLRGRDDACNLDRRISDREGWFRALEATPAKMTCVIRFTTGRNKRLSDWLDALNVEKTEEAAAPVPPAPPPPAPVPEPSPPAPPTPPPAVTTRMPSTHANCPNFTPEDGDAIYSCTTIITRQSGKWYYELEVKAGMIAQQREMALDYGLAQSEAPGGGGWLMHIRRPWATQSDLVFYIGVAIDLDDGFIYTSFQGQWRAKPGQVGGFPIKPRIYSVGRIGGSSDLRPLLDQGLVRMNSGEQPFRYAIPDGYRPFDIP